MKSKPGYKMTPLGWIPEGWKLKPLRAIANFTNGKAHENAIAVEGRYILVNSKFISSEGAEFKRSSVCLSPLQKNTITMVMSDVPNGKAIAKCFIIDEDHKYTLNQRICSLKVIEDNELYIYYSINRNKYYLQFDDGVSQTNLKKEEVLDCVIPLPPLPEQKAIAKLLSTWDKAIEITQEFIKQKELRKKYLMQQLLTGKKRLKGFSGEWKRYSYEELLKVVKRPVAWNDDELYQLISVRRRSGGIFQRESLYGKQILVKDLRTAAEGDFLFSKMQIVHGASALVTKEFAGAKISGSYIAVVPKNPDVLDIEFLNWYSRMPNFYHQTYISSYGVHIEKMTFDFDSFLTLPICIPGIIEQKAIIQLLNKAAVEIDILGRQLETLQMQKMGLMQVLLTGKKRLSKS